MMVKDELETHIESVRLDYRTLWLADAHTLGLIACTLAEALDWQPTPEAPLPDPLALAEVAATRLDELERLAGVGHRRPHRTRSLHSARFALS